MIRKLPLIYREKRKRTIIYKQTSDEEKLEMKNNAGPVPDLNLSQVQKSVREKENLPVVLIGKYLIERHGHVVVKKELDAQEKTKMNKPLEGQLYKYTNVVKGWQYRWFALLPETGILEYYMLDEVKKRRPRGAIYLAGAVISPSDEDSQSFAISAACGELYKLKANDAKERQFWVNRIRAVAERHTDTIAEKNPPLPPREILPPLVSRTYSNPEPQSVWYANDIYNAAQTALSHPKTLLNQGSGDKKVNRTASSVTEALSAVRDMLLQTEARLNSLTRTIELLPCSGNGPKCCDTDMLLLKATSAATLKSLQQCYTILQHQQVAINFPKAMVRSRKGKASSTASYDFNESTASDSSKDTSFTADPSGEITDYEEHVEKDFHLDTAQNATVLNLMSQLKLGADLTKVTMPSFILEPRSLLEMFADFMRYPQSFVRILNYSSAEERMVAVLEWYLTSFHAAREASASKKPYNPILGEMFRCSWKVPMEKSSENCKVKDDLLKVTFVAEQVSHHPPVSAFYVECPKKNMAMSAHICVKSNFLTSYVGVSFVGEVKLQLLGLGETYSFSLPSAYLRNILTVPWIELGGRISVTCSSSDYSAFVTFQTKPHASAVPHQIAGELKYGEELIYRVSGEWNGVICLTPLDASRKTKSIDVSHLYRCPKHIRPLDQQDAFESRKLWLTVTKALQEEDFAKAEAEKAKLEEAQREEERKQSEAGLDYHGKLFHKIGDIWEYKYPLPLSDFS